jgi:hypothetical protein
VLREAKIGMVITLLGTPTAAVNVSHVVTLSDLTNLLIKWKSNLNGVHHRTNVIAFHLLITNGYGNILKMRRLKPTLLILPLMIVISFTIYLERKITTGKVGQ